MTICKDILFQIIIKLDRKNLSDSNVNDSNLDCIRNNYLDTHVSGWNLTLNFITKILKCRLQKL